MWRDKKKNEEQKDVDDSYCAKVAVECGGE